jgi:hypothetical protein
MAVPPMTDADAAAYVDAACAVASLPLDDAARERVTATLLRVAAIAAPLLELALPADVEPPSTLPP